MEKKIFGITANAWVAVCILAALFALVSTAQRALVEPSTESLIAEVADA